MKKLKKLQKSLLDWVVILPKLIWEIILFVLNLPYYLYLFFYGLRITAISYSKLLERISSIRKTIDKIFDKDSKTEELTKTYLPLLNQTIELNKEQEKSFLGLFGIFIAILALFISVIALFFSRK